MNKENLKQFCEWDGQIDEHAREIIRQKHPEMGDKASLSIVDVTEESVFIEYYLWDGQDHEKQSIRIDADEFLKGIN